MDTAPFTSGSPYSSWAGTISKQAPNVLLSSCLLGFFSSATEVEKKEVGGGGNLLGGVTEPW